ncbi:PEP-CTERM sorting domain-containing protein [Crocosphaera sp. XPORK-15E]|uniref:PEP-CTERM sorting domain-containing protein n=1 Tax=Crocosphaera sp. XPORK-15E TaxID=3110247 RepID=UPI002B201A71|nr:PEP-CTERM sorting domain-containing protein [Crocosphaera sp. XPORK-15E]MEA5533537.1 PEP-CTERM sorting domain-containing protein [Crocosphaera sp. XPORK-15E]
MNNRLTNFSGMTKNLSNISLSCLTVFTLLLGISKQADAGVINFDANTYAFANPNTCTPQLAPGNKCFVEDGINVEAFSSRNTGSTGSDPGHFHEGGHFHASNSYEAQHFSQADRLLGVYLTLVNGRNFSLTQLAYQLRDITNVIDGFTADDTKILISTEFEPTQPVAGQFTEISLGNDINLPFQTLELSGFENISQVYIASSAGVNFDNINVVPIPEGNSVLGLLALGTVGFLSKMKFKDS